MIDIEEKRRGAGFEPTNGKDFDIIFYWSK